MGVMACDRRGCDSIMCDIYSDTYGYICDPCLSGLLTSNGTNIKHFMEDDKNNDVDSQSWQEYVNRVFDGRI